MRAVIQRVSEASVIIDEKKVASINKGLLVLLGIETEDTKEDSLWLASKIAQLRIFSDEDGVMNKSITEIDGFYVAAGDCGSGVSLSGGIGSVMSELILDGRSHLDIESFKADRFGKLDPFNSEFLKQCAKARSAKSRK